MDRLGKAGVTQCPRESPWGSGQMGWDGDGDSMGTEVGMGWGQESSGLG